MILSDVSVTRPVLAAVMSLLLVAFGLVSFERLPLREYPDIEPPVVSVNTFYRGASPNVVETEITDVLEEQFTTIESVKTITSSSREQGSVITSGLIIEISAALDSIGLELTSIEHLGVDARGSAPWVGTKRNRVVAAAMSHR